MRVPGNYRHSSNSLVDQNNYPDFHKEGENEETNIYGNPTNVDSGRMLSLSQNMDLFTDAVSMLIQQSYGNSVLIRELSRS